MEPLVLSFSKLNVKSQQHICLACRAFSASAVRPKQPPRRRLDPFREAQAQARRAANISRQLKVKKDRQIAAGDPVRSLETPFVKSFDTAERLPSSDTRSASIPIKEMKLQDSDDIVRTQPDVAYDIFAKIVDGEVAPANMSDTSSVINEHSESAVMPPGDAATASPQVNFFIRQDELEKSLARSNIYKGRSTRDATKSLMRDLDSVQFTGQPFQLGREVEHEAVAEAVRRITSMNLASSRDKLRVNKANIIDAFGRHNTDRHLPPKPAVSTKKSGLHLAPKPFPRAGPDTGSSEVQIAILTARIRTLAQFLSTRGKNDKMNKRNLRLLVHKRQKLLRYLERKERGGPRFQNVVDVLGLAPAAWRGEISL